eukprot:scaffold1422_cov48-Attheya_sp.AAC.3
MGKIITIAAIVGVVVCVGLPALLSELIGGWMRKYTSPRPIFSASSIGNLTGRVVIVTGANTGIGFESALEMARNGAHVIVAARSISKGQAAVSRIRETLETSSSSIGNSLKEERIKVQFIPLDLSSLQSVHQFATEFLQMGLPLHVLLLNAGVMKSPGAVFVGKNLTYGFEVTQDGFESHIGVNHIAHVYLTKLLTQKLKDSAPSRVVAVSSSAEEFAFAEGIRFDQWQPAKPASSSWSPSLPPPDYEDGLAYGQSKLANLLFVRELAKQLNGSGVTAYSCHPGVIQTELFRYLESKNEEDAKLSGTVSVWVLKLVGAFFNQALFLAEDGALTQLQLVTSPPEQLINGAFYHPIGRVQNSSHPQGQNETLPSILWEETERVIQSVVGSF